MAKDKIERNEPLARSRRKDHTGKERFTGAHVGRENREEQISRKDDTFKNVSITLEDIDAAIKYYFDNVLKPVVLENEKLIKVPTMFGSPERWKSIEKDGFFRDEKTKIILPLIMYKRTSISRDTQIPVDKIDKNIVYTFQQQFTPRNRYDRFSVLFNKKPTKERFNVIVADYVILEYECIAWTSYVSQMNKIVELLQHSSEDYWGSDERFKFYTIIESLDQTIDVSTNTERAVRTNFTLKVKGYLIPESYNELMNTQKLYTNQQIILDVDADVSFVTDEIAQKLSIADKDGIKKIFQDDFIDVSEFSSSLSSLQDDSGSWSTRVTNVEDTASRNETSLSDHQLILGDIIIGVGNGVPGRLAIWDGTGSITSDSGIFFNTSSNVLILTGSLIVSESVGIGTDPNASLHVTGSTIFGGDVNANIHEFTGSIQQTGSGATSYFIDRIGIGTETPGAKLHISSSDLTASLRVDGNASGTASFYVSASGNIGIGTEEPQSLLHVFGIISASNVLTDQGGTFWTASGDNITRDSNVEITGNLNISADVTVQGIITAEEFHTEFVSSSIIFQSGSTKFGDTLDDLHEQTGSVDITGSFNVVGTASVSELTWTGAGNSQNLSAFSASAASRSAFLETEGSGGFWTGSGANITRESDVEITGTLSVSGSTKFGELLTETHVFTGSLLMTSSIIFHSSDNNASTPAIAFGADANTGIVHEDGGDQLRFIIGGSGKWNMDGTSFTSGNTRGNLLRRVTGTYTDPCYGINGDTNTGLSSGASDELELITNGVNALHIDSSQNIGIGTTGPTARLHISGSTAEQELLRIQNSSGSEMLFISSSGKVGIGITTPEAPLHVNQGDVPAAIFNRDGNGTMVSFERSSTLRGFISLNSNDEDAFTFRSAGDISLWGGSTRRAVIVTSTGEVIISGSVADQNIFRIRNSVLEEMFFVSSSGNVGIGTTDPQTTLHINKPAGDRPLYIGDSTNVAHGMTSLVPTSVYGSFDKAAGSTGGLQLTGFSEAGSVPGLILRGIAGGDPTVAAVTFRAGKKSGTTAGDVVNADVAFAWQDIGNNNEYMTILGNGEVGIGTTPTERLHLYGGNGEANLLLVSETTGNSGATIKLFISSSSPFTTDRPGIILFDSLNSSAIQKTFGQFSLITTALTNNNEGGEFRFDNLQAGTLTRVMTLDHSGSVGIFRSTVDTGFKFQVSGSAKLGDLTTDVHEFTGSINMKSVLTVSGTVGIGTDSADERLHIRDSAQVYLKLDAIGGYIDNSPVGGIKFDYDVTGNEAASIIMKSSGSNEDGGHLAFSTMQAGSSAERFRIRSDGNVGIGTTNPDSKLEILAGGNSVLAAFRLTHDTATSDRQIGVAFQLGTSNPPKAAVALRNIDGNTDGTGFLGFFVDSSGDSNDVAKGDLKMLVSGSGDVGIGTATPKELLHVFGIISASNILTDQGGTFWTASGDNITRDSNVEITGSLIVSGGNMAIGTSTTQIPLTIKNANPAVQFSREGSYTWQLGIEGGSAMSASTSDFVIYDTSLKKARIVIRHTTGLLGMGAKVPTARLHISGTVAAEELLRIQNSTGTEVLFVSSSGNVGIGITTALIAPLSIQGDGTTAINIIRDGSNAGVLRIGGTWILSYDGSETRLDGSSVDIVFKGSNNFLRGTWDSTGNLGITNANPTARLHISGSTAVDELLRIQNSSGSEMFFVSSSGNVGIGVTTPEKKLHVAGDILLDNNKTVAFKNAAGNIMPGMTVNTGDDLVFGETSANGLDDIIFQTADVNTAMIIKQTGDVGIGTATPQELLHVFGAISASALLVNNKIDVTGSVNIVQKSGTNLPTISPNTLLLVANTGSDATISIIGSNTGNSILNFGDLADENIFNMDYDHTANHMDFKLGSEKVFTFRGLNNGRLGIGPTSTPTAKLHVSGSATVEQLLRIQNSTGDEMLFVSSSGNVGIGTSTPINPLVILGKLSFMTADGTETRGNWNPGTVGSQGGTLVLADKDGSSTVVLHSGNGNSSYFKQGILGIGLAGPSAQLHISGSTAEQELLRIQNSSGSEVLFISSSGNIGIGTTVPTAIIQIDQGADDGDIFRGASSDVAHGMTSLDGLTTDIYFAIRKAVASKGGVKLQGISDGNNDAVVIEGISTLGDTGRGTVILRGRQKSGTSATALNDTEIVVEFQNDTITLMGIDGQGNVGIGKNLNLSAKLHISGSTAEQELLRIQNSSGSEVLFISSSGNIGIGTTTGNRPLIILNVNPVMRFNRAGSYAWDIGVEGAVLQLGANTSDFVIYDSSENKTRLSITHTNGLLGIGMKSATARLHVSGAIATEQLLRIQDSSGSEMLFVTSSGNVGIGKTTPEAKLDVAGGILIPNGQVYGIENSAGSNGVALWADGTDFINLGNDSLWAGIKFVPGTSEKMRLTSAGRLGIGALSPLSKFHISGSVAEEELFRIQNSSGSEMLFVSSSGKVGIGTGTPASTLEISSPGEATLTLNSDNDANEGDTDVLVRFEIDGHSFKGDVGYNQGNDVMQIRYTGATGLNINSSNFVGIGNTNPSVRLQVSGSTKFGDLSTETHEFTGSVFMDTLHVTVFSGSVDIAPGPNARIEFSREGTERGQIGIVSGVMALAGGGSETKVLALANTNRVGIRTLGPSVALEVSGSTKFGNLPLEEHQFTGSVSITGSLVLGVSGSIDGKDNRIVAVTGSFQKLEKATGTFKIPHPDPSKPDKNLYHSFVESPTAGDNIYRYKVEAQIDNEEVVIDLPDYFRFLNGEPDIFTEAIGMFAQSYAWTNKNLTKLYIKCEKAGKYRILAIATRIDKDAVQAWTGTERKK